MWIVVFKIVFISLTVHGASIVRIPRQTSSSSGDTSELPLTCESPIYCYGPVLETVQMARIFQDSKTFVDQHMLHSQNQTLENFDEMMEKTNHDPTREEVMDYVKKNFDDTKELEVATLVDWKECPENLQRIEDPEVRKFAYDLNSIWPQLARKVIQDVYAHPEKHSIEPIPNEFVIPGGRFKEPYYWDSYWIITGLLVCDMPTTSRHMIENFFWLVDKHGFVPNGARVYYSQRSQPPLLTAMVGKYVEYTNDYAWLKQHMKLLDKELNFWLNHHTQDIGGHTLLRYYAPSQGPRPESYREDYQTANNDTRKYIQLKTGAESGWDFSGRWFWTSNYSYSLNLSDIDIIHVIPVDLNAIFCGAAGKLAKFYDHFGENEKAQKWNEVRDQIRKSMYNLLWNEEEGVWFDYHFLAQKQRKEFFPSNVAPLWMQCLADQQDAAKVGDQVAAYLERSGALKYPGGIPTSLTATGEQWDFPNAWPPLQTMVIEGLELSGSQKAAQLAYDLTKRWVQANLIGYKETQAMFEKYDVENPGRRGGGGEYDVQKGFGWTNGAVLDMINKYAGNLTVDS